MSIGHFLSFRVHPRSNPGGRRGAARRRRPWLSVFAFPFSSRRRLPPAPQLRSPSSADRKKGKGALMPKEEMTGRVRKGAGRTGKGSAGLGRGRTAGRPFLESLRGWQLPAAKDSRLSEKGGEKAEEAKKAESEKRGEGQPMPVLPKPPAPRWVSSSESVSSQTGRRTGATTSWAIRSPGETAKFWSE